MAVAQTYYKIDNLPSVYSLSMMFYLPNKAFNQKKYPLAGK